MTYCELDYNQHVEAFREKEYPMLKDAIYLDHAGTTLYSKSLMETFMADMMSNLYGNPHSASPSSQLSTTRIEDIRLMVLQFFKADPDDFDVILVANATAGIKLVMDAFRGMEGGFNFGYHVSSHTSLVGVRENATASRCLEDEDVERWLHRSESLVDGNSSYLNLFGYPAQSNLNGQRFPISWAHKTRETDSTGQKVHYSLLDASAYVSTSQLDLSDAAKAPDFTVLSFYKIFGFPDLGALIVRKDSATIFRERKYFGGGTVDVVLCLKEQWHAPKVQTLHDSLEDGTLPIHSILALDAAIKTHRNLYGSMDQIAKHTAFLAQKLHDGLASLKHSNHESVCIMQSKSVSEASTSLGQGPVVAFNVRNIHGAWVSNIEFERLASVKKFHLRTGGLCNPGGIASTLKLEAWEMRRNFSAGFKCGAENDIYSGKITGVIRVSLGAMSTISDVEAFISFVEEFYVEDGLPLEDTESTTQRSSDMLVESLTVYPIKSCGGFVVPPNTEWEVRPEGLVWDREWCLVHQGTGQNLSQKRYPRMALIRPVIDTKAGVMRVTYFGDLPPGVVREISVPLSENPSFFSGASISKGQSSRVCGEAIVAQTYLTPNINDFFSKVLDVPCALARFPAGGSGLSTRHAKAHMQKHQRKEAFTNVLALPPDHTEPLTPPDSDSENARRPILLSNESPILAINRSSLDALNAEISRTGGKLATASVFRANIVLAPASTKTFQIPYSEDHWSTLRIGQQNFQMLGSCRRCHMICVDQNTAEKDSEPFVTLAKTRRLESKVFFGSHMCHIPSDSTTPASQRPTIEVGDVVTVQS